MGRRNRHRVVTTPMAGRLHENTVTPSIESARANEAESRWRQDEGEPREAQESQGQQHRHAPSYSAPKSAATQVSLGLLTMNGTWSPPGPGVGAR